MANIIFVGVSHISPESSKLVEKAITEKNPDIVAIELDPLRYQALLSGIKKTSISHGIREFGLINFFILELLMKLQNTLSEQTGVMAGTEMLKAAEIAKKNKIPVALIDRDIRRTTQELNKISLLEKLNVLLGIFLIPFAKKDIMFDLKEIPAENKITQMLEIMREKLPEFYRVLVAERDVFMAKFLLKLSKKYNKIVVVVGAGHMTAIKNYLREFRQ